MNLVDQVHKLERNMEAEIKRRMEADKALHDTLEHELKGMHEKHNAQMHEVRPGVFKFRVVVLP